MAKSTCGIYKCLYNFHAETGDDLELQKGDVIKVTKQISGEWLYAANSRSCGQVPVSFVELVLDVTPGRVGVVSEDFVSEHHDDLQLSKGDVIGINKNIDDNWCHGFSRLGTGMFPVNFVKELKFYNSNGTESNSFDNNNNNNSTKEDIPVSPNIEYGEAKVIDSFQAQEPDELTISTGDVVMLTKEIDSFWIEGILNGTTGKFPRMYVDIVTEVPEKLKFKDEKRDGEDERKSMLPEPQAKALYMFVGTNPEELSFDKGDVIVLLERLNKDWLVGKIGLHVGRFPSNYVEVLVDLPFTNKPLPPQGSTQATHKTMAENSAIQHNTGANSHHTRQAAGSRSPVKPAPPVSRSSIKTTSKEQAHINGSTNKKPQTSHRASPAKPGPPVNRHSTKTSHAPQPDASKRIPAKDQSQTNDSSSTKQTTQHTSSTKEQGHTNDRSPAKSPQTQTSPLHSPTKTKVVASTIPAAQKKRASAAPPPARTSSFRHSNPGEATISEARPVKSVAPVQQPRPKLEEVKPVHHHAAPQPPLASTIKGPPPSVQRKSSLRGKKKAPVPPPTATHQFELVEEKIFDMYSKPAYLQKPKPPPKSPGLSPQSPTKQQDLLSTSAPKQATSNKSSTLPRLPKPLAPMPAGSVAPKSPSAAAVNNKARPVSLNMQQQHHKRNNGVMSGDSPVSPISSINPKSFSASFSKKRPTVVDFEQGATGTLSRSETDPVLSSRDTSLAVGEPTMKPSFSSNGIQRERPKSLYFASASNSTPSPEKRSQTLDAVLQRSSSLRAQARPNVPKTPTMTTNGAPTNMPFGSSESLSQSSIDLKRIDTDIAELKSKIEAEAHLLSGVETLLDFVSEDKKPDLYSKQDQHNANIVEMNEDLIALEDQKSYLLASLGEVDDILHRVEELEKQISMYFDNCEQLRLMQDVAIVEELPEIRDSIEFCENMVDTLQDELNGLKAKLGEMGQLDQVEAVEDDIEEKKKKKQMKVIEELITTETNYCHDISLLLATMQELEELEDTDVQTEVLFGNLPDIVQLSAKLLQQLKDIDLEAQNDVILKSIALAFVNLSHEMKNCYAVYCRNYDDAQVLKEKYEEDPVTWNHIASAIIESSESPDGFNLGSYLIKPVQRVLKYPLLLSELYKNQLEEGTVKEELKHALTTVTDVATAINEFKRRKDLVQKYRETEDNLGKRVQKLNWHSVAKKSSRINQKITQFTGLNSQTVDEGFNDDEKRFRIIEKLIKTILKNIVQFDEEFRENSLFQKQCAESFHQVLEGEGAHEDMVTGYHKMFKTTETYTDDMLTFIKTHVTEPLSQLLQLFQAPFRLIQKRHDKCLDYDRAKNKAQRAKDSREREKITQTEQELQACENVYTALNSQLLEEMPLLCQKSASFVLYCLQNFTEARKRYFTKMFFQLDALWQLPFFKKEVDILDNHHERIQQASDELSNLAYNPVANKDTLRKTSTNQQNLQNIQSQQQQQTLLNNFIPSTHFFVDLETNTSTAKQPAPTLIDLNEEEQGQLLVDISSPPLTPSLEFNGNSILIPNKVSYGDLSNEADAADITTVYIVRYDFIAENTSEITLDAGAEVNILRRCDKSGNSEWWLVEQSSRKGYIPASFLSEETRKQATTPASNQEESDRTPGSFLETSTHKYEEKNEKTSQSKFYNLDQHQSDKPTSNSTFYSTTEDADSKTNEHPLPENKPEIKVTDTSNNLNDDHKQYILEYDFEAMNTGELGAREGQTVTCVAKHDQKGNTEWWLVECDGQRGYIPRDYLSYVDNTKMC